MSRRPPVTDRDEDGDYPTEFFTYGEPCENCGTACETDTRVWIPGFNYWACDQCAEECRITIFAEENCPALYRAITRARTVAGVQKAYWWHKHSCPNCNPKLATLPAKQEKAA